jgi:hypothetical protein
MLTLLAISLASLAAPLPVAGVALAPDTVPAPAVADTVIADTVIADTLADGDAPFAGARAVAWSPRPAPALPTTIPALAADTPRAPAIEYSDWYYRRLTIHRWASYAVIPVFVAQYVVGEKLMDDREDGRSSGEDDDSKWKGTHSALAGTVAGLFGVNTVTGLWNLWEARKDPAGRTRRTLHSIAMLAADAGFVATAATAEGGSRDTHRAIAVSSMGLAAATTAMMWIWKE